MKKYTIKKEQTPENLEDVEIEVVTSRQVTQKSTATFTLKGIDTQIASREKQITMCQEEIDELLEKRKGVEKEAKKFDLTQPAEMGEATTT